MTADETPVVVRSAAETQQPLRNRGLMSPDDDCERLRKLRPVGVEPTTYGLEIRCSIQLSYGRVSADFKAFIYCLRSATKDSKTGSVVGGNKL